MATYGEIRMRLQMLAPGVGPDLLDGWIMDRYQEILDALTWKRLAAAATIVTKAEYNTGTVAVTNGSNVVTGTGTTWTAAMTGRVIRIGGAEDYYEFTYVGATSGTLDRVYSGADTTGAGYRLNQNVYPLASDVRLVHGVRTATGELHRTTTAELRRWYPARNSYGTPFEFAWYMDSGSNPPVIQIELFPIPTETVSLYVDLEIDTDGLEKGVTSSSLLPWTREGCLVSGVQADVGLHLDKRSAASHQARFLTLLARMMGTEAQSHPASFGMASRFTRHRLRRVRG
jgi:hypothetical protein